MVRIIKEFIPGLPNALVVGALRFFSLFSFISKKKRSRNRDINIEELRTGNLTGKDGFIENQHAMKDLMFGKTDMAYAGCEIIAVYNALLSLGFPKDLPELISTFEKKGSVLGGRFGTSPYALYRYLSKVFDNVSFSFKRRDFEKLAQDSRVFIITYYNDAKDIMQQIHTVCVTKDKDEGMHPHNAYCRETGICSVERLEQALGVEGRGKILFMTGIKQNEEKERKEENK
ncbi:MAG: hypothetical protein K6F86_10635 [Lachnospiraceae bacterium]|nr:hypothetical protein [Lachnospiraceae bacterium]